MRELLINLLSNYIEERLSSNQAAENSDQLRETASRGQSQKIYCYFNNNYHGYAPENCLQLLERLGLLSEEQKKAKAKNVIKQSQLGSVV